MGLKVWLWSWGTFRNGQRLQGLERPQLLSPLLKISTKFGNGVAEICDLGKTLMVAVF
jgi:hypothetical protein